MACVLHAIQTTTQMPVLWATTQFAGAALLGDDLRINVQKVSGGRRVWQVLVTMHCGDKLVLQTLAAAGERDYEQDKQFVSMPEVTPPEDSPPKKPDAYGRADNLAGQFERRSVLEDNDSGTEKVWTRPRFTTNTDASLLAMISDFYLGAHKRSRGGTSLDNTLRICNLRQTEWILASTKIASFSRGCMQGSQYIFAKDGTLLAISSQSGLLPRTPNL